MPSNIDPTQPPQGAATTAAVRSNFTAAKAEIEALQAAAAAFSILQTPYVRNDNNVEQPFFPVGQDEFTAEANTTYLIEGHISINRTAGGYSHALSVLFAGTATFAAARYNCICRQSARSAAVPAIPKVAEYSGITPSIEQVVAPTAADIFSVTLDFFGAFITDTAGTIIPKFKYNSAPGGAPTIERGSYFKFTKVGDNTITTGGAWT